VTAALTTGAGGAELGALLDVEALDERVRALQRAAKAAATLRAYRADWDDFAAWCAAQALDALPARPETVSRYLAHLEGSGAAPPRPPARDGPGARRPRLARCRRHHRGAALPPGGHELGRGAVCPPQRPPGRPRGAALRTRAAGLATAAAAAGAAERDIMRQTGHRSTATVRRYIRAGELFHDNVSGVLGL
jgi:hypothetical protein